MPRRGSPYGGEYERLRQNVIAAGLECRLGLPGCTGRATSLDHVPPLAEHTHIAGSNCCILNPVCLRCNIVNGNLRRQARANRAEQPRSAWTSPPSAWVVPKSAW